MLIAQISDLHVVAPGARAYGRIDTNRALADAIDALNRLDPQPDVVLCTGDLTQGGDDAEYAALCTMLAELNAPFLPLLGNHDRRHAFRRTFSTPDLAFGPDPFIQYERAMAGLRVIALDTVTAGSDEPGLDAARLAWLAARLERPHPTLLAMHHPPFACGVGWLEPADPSWSEPLAALVAATPHIVGVLCGHVHRTMVRRWQGFHAVTAPSTAHQVALHLSPSAQPEFACESPGLLIHSWDGREISTYAVSIPGFLDRFEPGSRA